MKLSRLLFGLGLAVVLAGQTSCVSRYMAGLRYSAQKGDAEDQTELGICYFYGKGVTLPVHDLVHGENARLYGQPAQFDGLVGGTAPAGGADR